ncbi:hypothetical protein GDO86_015386 [Hymenochirus boettgeri]|uniref:DUF4592 domain-containing protein n=1 Tax=Hymenochirus boettgeri TaxID=247094 RepID=A0A8T2JV99_9PIPI|nr:hypothetical protein GDO86_015386 [Hymenochirus boettgeri]
MSALYSCLKGKNDPIMTASTADRVQNLEAEEAHEECAATGKKKSKFKTFKKFFVKKKDRRKELPVPSSENILKPSQSSGDVCVSGASSNVLHPENDPRAKGYMGNKALSHDSVFMAESENTTKEHSSCENIPGRVKALQMQLQQNIRVGSSPQIITRKKIEDTGALSEDDGLPRSPPEISTLHEILSHSSDKPSKAAQRRSSLSLGGTDSEDEQVSSRPHSLLHCNIRSHPTTPATFLLPKDFSSPASPLGCLDNSAAKHRIAVKPKKQKGPAVKRKLIAGEESKVAQQDQCEDTQQDQCEDTPQDQCHEAPQDQCDDTQQDQYEDTQQDQYEDTQQDQYEDTQQDQYEDTQQDQYEDTQQDQYEDTLIDQYEDTPQDQSKGAHEDQYEGTWNDQCGDTQEDQPEGAQKGQPLETHMTHSLKPADEMEVTNRENTRNEGI